MAHRQGKDHKNKDSKLHPAYLHCLVKNLASEDWWWQAGASTMYRDSRYRRSCSIPHTSFLWCGDWCLFPWLPAHVILRLTRMGLSQLPKRRNRIGQKRGTHIYKSSLMEEPFCRAFGEVKREKNPKKTKTKPNHQFDCCGDILLTRQMEAKADMPCWHKLQN